MMKMNENSENLLYSFEKSLDSSEGKEELIQYVTENGGECRYFNDTVITGKVHFAYFRYFLEEGWCGVVGKNSFDINGKRWSNSLSCYTVREFIETVLKVSE